MDECDSLCPNKQTIQNAAKSTTGLNMGLRFVGSENPNPSPFLAPSQASPSFTPCALLLLIQGLKLRNILTVSLVSLLL